MKASIDRKALAAAAMLFAALAGCGGNGGRENSEKVTAVETGAIASTMRAVPVRASGVVASVSEMRLSFKTGGIIGPKTAREGQAVRKGDMLASLDLREIRAGLDAAQSAYDKASRDLERVRNLYADKVATLEQLQNAETAFEVAGSSLTAARFNLDHSVIRAPEDGTVLKRFAEPNELVGPGTPVFLFAATAKGWVVKANVPGRDILRIERGDSASVALDLYPGTTVPARVTETARAAGPMTGTYEVELELDRASLSRGKKTVSGEGAGGETASGTVPLRLFSGFTAKVWIFPAGRTEMSLVPIGSIVDADGSSGYVFLLPSGGDRVRKAEVAIGAVLGDMVAVEGDFLPGESVVTVGAPYLKDGAKVETGGDEGKSEVSE